MTKTMKQAESVAMRRALTTGLLAAAALSAAAERVAVAQASPDAVVKAQLAALGKRRTAELVTEMIVAIPWDGGIAPRASSAEGGDVQVPGKGGKPHEIYVGTIPSLGAVDSCARPTAEERAAVITAVAAADPAMRAVEGSSVRFGCKEKGGILLDVAYEDRKTGTWKVVRASDLSAKARISVVASYRGTPTDQWMEWANEVTLSTLALADLDGDGTRDALLAQDQHEGGAMGHDVTLSLWLSSKGKVVALGTLSGAVSIAAQPWKPAASAATAAALPLVVRAAPLTSEDRLHYRCVQLAGKLDTCSAIEAAWKAERALGVAQRFIAGELCEPERDQWGQLKESKGPCVLDAEMMAAQLDVLGTSAAERALLLAKLPPPSAKAQVKRAVHAALEVVMPQKRVYGELIETPTGPDPRRAELLPLLGDAECPPATPAQTKALEARINGWLAGNAARLLVERGACKPGTPCQWKKPDRFAAQQTCSAGGRAQLAGRWTHLGEQGAQLAIDALFYVDAKTVKLTASDSEIGDALDCAACGGPATQQLETQLFRHGDALVALSKMSSNGKTPNLIELTVDGAVTPLPQLEGARWYNFGEKYGSDPVAPSVMQLRTGDDTPDTYWHWDGSWKQIATFPAPGVLTAEPKLDAAGAWMWRQNQRSAARQLLIELDADEWALKPRYREEVSRALALVNAPAELAARVQTLARGQ